MTTPSFRVGLTRDFYDASGVPKYSDFGLSVLEAAPHIQVAPFSQHHPEIAPEQLNGLHGVVVLTPSVTARSLADAGDLLAIGRFGVGYDAVDVKACTAAGVAVCITTGAVDRPVAEAVAGWLIALTHRMTSKHRLVQMGNWDDRSNFMGSELRDRTLGVIGLGGIARCLLKLLENWGMNPPLAYDPYADPAAAERAGARLVDLDTLLAQSDFVSVHCPLTPQTRNLLGAREIALMKPGAFLINTARGGIVNEDALYDALCEKRLGGAGLDCFEQEPVRTPHRFGELENVLLAPHAIAWTNELFRDIGRAAFNGMVDLSHGRKPRGVVNPEVFAEPQFLEKWKRVTGLDIVH